MEEGRLPCALSWAGGYGRALFFITSTTIRGRWSPKKEESFLLAKGEPVTLSSSRRVFLTGKYKGRLYQFKRRGEDGLSNFAKKGRQRIVLSTQKK